MTPPKKSRETEKSAKSQVSLTGSNVDLEAVRVIMNEVLPRSWLHSLALLGQSGGDEEKEAAEIFERIDRKLAVEEALTQKLMQRYGL